MILENSKIYVVHAKQGYEFQEERLKRLFKEYGLNFEFVVDGDPSNFNQELLDKYFDPQIFNKYSKGAISCTLNHILSLEKLVRSNKSFAIIFENDPFFLSDFVKQLIRLTDEVKSLEKRFIVSLENTTLTFPSFFQTRSGKYLYRATHGRMAGAYLIDREGAEAAIKDLRTNKCHDIIDWWHNRLISRDVLKMYWAHPPLVEQGSHNGKLNGAISTKKKRLSRQIVWNVQKFYKMYIRRLFNQKRIIN